MKLTASIELTEQFFPIDLPNDFSFLDFKAYISSESDIVTENIVVLLNSQEVNGDEKTIEELGFKDDDLLVIRDKSKAQATSAIPDPVAQHSQNIINNPVIDQQIEQLRQQLLSNPQMRTMSGIPENLLNDPAQFKEFAISMSQQQQQQQGPQGVSQEEWARLNADPDNPDNQKRIMEIIEQDMINENLASALENTPESFTQVSMLYINVEVNGFPIKAFVDSGAQQTIINSRLAERCNLTRLIDKRYRGEAHGVGKTAILGRIHSAPLKIENQFIPCSFTVLDTHVDMLLGLDMLKRHQANIDLKRHCLVIADIETPFLPDNEVPNINPLLMGQGQGQQLGGSSSSSSSSAATLTGSASSASTTKPSAASAAAQAAEQRNTNASASSSSRPAAATPAAPAASFDDTTILNLMSLGFSKDEVVRALRQANGNAEIAASILFN